MMTENELLTWLERWFFDNTPCDVDSASPRSEVWLIDDQDKIVADQTIEVHLFDLRDLCDALVELGRAEHRRAEMRFVIFGEVAP